MTTIHLNHEAVEVRSDPSTPLLTILRDDLGLMGAKHACGLEQCGACLVFIDGHVRPSCRIPVGELDGRTVHTIEGQPGGEIFERVRQAFIAEEALQCGMCTSGFIMAAVALLEKNPEPSDEAIHQGLDRNLCRCGVYPRIFRAVRQAAGRPVEQRAVEVIDTAPMGEEPPPPSSLPASLERAPELDQWLRIDPEETVTLFAGKVEYGQGILTALAQVAAEELDVDFRRMRVVTAATGLTPDEGMTVGSMSLMTTGVAVQTAAAEARAALLSMALEELEADPDRLHVEDGTITDPASGRTTTYWALLGGRSFGRTISGKVPRKSPDSYRLLGRAAPRLDLAQKTSGAPVYLHDFQLPGMRYARVLRPPKPGAALLALDGNTVKGVPGVESVYRDGSFAAVIARDPHAASAGLEALSRSADWDPGPELPGGEDPIAHLKSQPAQSFHIVDGTPVEGSVPDSRVIENGTTLRASYSRPFQMHASIVPSAAVAQYDGAQLTLWVHSQGVYPLRRYIAHALGLGEASIHVVHLEGPGCYGHNGSDDAAFDAALLAFKHPGEPVQVAWSRTDEHRWEPYTPAIAVELAANLDSEGRITAWDHQVWSYPHLGRSSEGGEISGLLGAWYRSAAMRPPSPRPSTWSHSGGYRNADPLYVLPNKRVVKHFVRDRPLRTSSMRGLGAFGNVFAIESFMDELAHTAGTDPLDFRLAHLQDPRAREVLQAAADLAGWTPAERPSRRGAGRGMAFAQYKNRAAYCAVVVDVEFVGDRIRLQRAYIAADAGQLVNPDGLANQLEGGLVQAASWTLKEAVDYGPEGIRSNDWERYPILRFSESPQVRTVLLNRPGAPFLGSGEASSGPAGAAIANAVFDATGRRLRDLPLKLDKLPF